VSLVAILDADKEGFLRSERSLIQTIGRAARHLHGTAILYADRITDSMKAAIGETERRRARQLAFNAANGITPKSVTKRIKDIIDGVYDASVENAEGRPPRRAPITPRSTRRPWRRPSASSKRKCRSTPATWSSRKPPPRGTSCSACASRPSGPTPTMCPPNPMHEIEEAVQIGANPCTFGPSPA
jgi:hypothetical protein